MISPLYLSEGTSPRGFILRYSGVRGTLRSIISSLNGMASSLRATWARCAQGQLWLV